MTVCCFQDGELKTLLETTYTSFITSDLDTDGADDLVLLTTDATDRRIAQLYSYANNKLEFKGETSLSPEGQTVVSLKKGWLRGYQPAVFAESKLELSAGLMTDIFTYDEDGFRNIALEGDEVSEQGTYRPVSIPSTDVNSDQVTEVPAAVGQRCHLYARLVCLQPWRRSGARVHNLPECIGKLAVPVPGKLAQPCHGQQKYQRKYDNDHVL